MPDIIHRMRMRFQAAPVGAISLAAICLTACFPLVGLLRGPWRYAGAAVVVFCGFSFTPAIVCCIYSIAKEKLKSFGAVGLVIAAVMVWLERDTLWFIELGLFEVPCMLLVTMVIFKRRARAKERALIP